MSKQEPLVYGRTYHIYNRGNNGEIIFCNSENYRYFLQQYGLYIQLMATTFAYCLMPNHFHFLVYILTEKEQEAYHQRFHLLERWNLLYPTNQFRRFFTSYAMAFNRQQQRTGTLFQKNFRRKSVNHECYFTRLITYIHQNPQEHGFVNDFRDWPWSSYNAIISNNDTKVAKNDVLDWCGGQAEFVDAHQLELDESTIEPLIAEDWFQRRKGGTLGGLRYEYPYP